MSIPATSSLLNPALLNALNELNGFGPLFSSTTFPSLANPASLAATAAANLTSADEFPSEQVLALSGLLSQASALTSAAAPFVTSPLTSSLLTQTDSPVLTASPFSGTSATSSSSAVTASSAAGATLTDYQVAVNQLATSQQDTGLSLTSASSTTFNTGTFSIDVTTEYGTAQATTTPVSYSIYAGFTQQQSQQALADAINSANLGLSASVTTSGSTSQLVLSSSTPGTQLAFALNDVAGGNGIAQAFGNASVTPGVAPGDAVVTAAQDAIYSVNGVLASSAGTTNGNTVSEDSGKVTLTLANTTSAGSPATVTVASANTNLAAEVTSLVTAYNNIQTFVTGNSGTLSATLAPQLQAAASRQASTLSSIGITINTDGTLSVNATTLDSAASGSPSSIESALSGPQGLATQLNSFAGGLLTSLEQGFGQAAPQALDTSQLSVGLAGLFPDVLAAATLYGGGLVNIHA
ncbi:MAG TPA: flagellar filament capping protein FliD [Chloroflexota bacterium]|nr:flagellar filament capping protein FliD [Chloroflexota bacterium]